MSTAQLQPSNIPPMKLKLIINKHTQQLLFAEVDENFVNFLFKIPSLPVGTLLNLFKGTEDVNPCVVGGSLGNLYRTIENFDKSYISKVTNNTPVQLTHQHSTNSFPTTVVKVGRYMVMDDLSVELMTSISLLDRLNKFGILNSKNLEEKEVEFDKYKEFFFLKEILMTKNVLSSVFLGNKYNNCDDANDYVMADHISSMQPVQGLVPPTSSRVYAEANPERLGWGSWGCKKEKPQPPTNSWGYAEANPERLGWGSWGVQKVKHTT